MNTKSNKTIRIAQVVGKWLGGGVEAVVMNYYRNIDRDKFQFDFICDNDSTDIPYEEIASLGGKVILIPPYQKPFKYYKELKRILKDGNYTIVHSHINTLSVFSLFAAKKAGVPIRIAHSHSTTNKKEWKKHIIKEILKPFSKTFATNYMACSESAGRWLFGKKAYDNGHVYLLNNAIELDKYRYNEILRKEKRKELNIKKTDIIIGHVGRFVKVKNHSFIIDVFNSLHRENNNYKLLLIGQGPMENEIKSKVYNLNIQDSVIFLGQISNVNEYYQAMDIMIFPSLYEGLGLACIEAQAASLPLIVSTNVPNAVKVSDKIRFLELNQTIETWQNEIKKINITNRETNINSIKDAGYDIKTEAYKLEKEYQKLLKTNNSFKINF